MNKLQTFEKQQDNMHQSDIFKKLVASQFLSFNPKNTALLYTLNMRMKERHADTREDVVYPHHRVLDREVSETLEQPPMFEISFYYHKIRSAPMFRIFAVRINRQVEQYSIEIRSEEKIKSIMN